MLPIMGLDPLPTPYPPDFEDALGYKPSSVHGSARYVGFYYFYGDLMIHDGRISSSGGNWWAWSTFLRHPAVAPTLHNQHFGYDDEDPQNWLVLDIEAKLVYVIPPQQARRFLDHQWPVTEDEEKFSKLPAEEQREIMDAALQNIQDLISNQDFLIPEESLSMSQVQERRGEQAKLLETMVRWLDQHG